MNKVRISYLLSGFGFTGGSMVLYKFMDKLVERGYEVFAITPFQRVRWEVGLRKKVVLSERRNVIEPKVALKWLAKRVMKMSSEIERWGLSQRIYQTTSGLLRHWVPSPITISTYYTTAFANYVLMDQTVPVYHIQGYEEYFFEDVLFQKVARLTYYLPLNLMVNSRWLQKQIQIQIGRDSQLVNPGIDTQLFYPRVPMEQKYNAYKKFKIVSYYAPPKFKGWAEAVKAMHHVFQQLGYDRVEWIVFGRVPPVKPNLPVKFVGKVFGDSLAELYSSAHVVFMNSWFESFPLPPIEAMACGTAVITTRIGTEDYAVDGENALVIPPKDPEKLAQSIVRLAEDPALAHNLAKNGVDTASQFTWDRAADRLEEILHVIFTRQSSR